MKRFGALVLAMLTAVILQTTVFAKVRLLEVTPDVVLVFVISLAVLEGPTLGASSGFGAGLLRDLLLEAPKGITGLSYLVVGYVVGAVRPYVQTTSVLLPVSAVLIGSLVGSALYMVLLVLLGRQPEPFDRVLRVITLTGVYNTLLVPFVYPLARRVTSAYPREKVFKL